MKFYKIQLNNTSQGQITLQYDPIDWKDLEFSFVRHKKYEGVTVEFSIEAQFPKDGREYLIKAYETYGLSAEVEIAIFYLENTRKYAPLFNGRVNFKSYQVEDITVTVDLEESELTRKLLINDNQKIDLLKRETLTGDVIAPRTNETHTIKLHSRGSSETYEATSEAEQNVSDNVQVSLGESFKQLYFKLPFESVVVDEVDDMFQYPLSQSLDTPITNSLYDISAVVAGTYDINIDFDFYYYVFGTGGGGIFSQFSWQDFALEIFAVRTNSIDVVQETNSLFLFERHTRVTEQFYPTDNQYKLLEDWEYKTISRSMTFDMNVGDKVYFYIRTIVNDFNNNNLAGDDFVPEMSVKNTRLRVESLTVTPDSTAEAIPVFECFERIINSITNRSNILESEYYGRTDSEPRTYSEDGQGSKRLILPGFWIRKFPGSGPSSLVKKMYQSFEELYDVMNKIDCIGVGIKNGEVLIEPKRDFYKREIILDLGSIEKVKKRLVIDRYVSNIIKAGYKNWKNEETNNLDEFCAPREFSTPLDQIKRTENLLEDEYLTSGYSVEVTRRKPLATHATEDTEWDDSNFIIQSLRDGVDWKAEKDEAFAELLNVISKERIYNAQLSPRRNVERWAYYIHAALYRSATVDPDAKIRFQSGEGNLNMASRLNSESVIIKESDDILIKDMDDPIFIPEIYEFEGPFYENYLPIIKDNSYGIIKFTDEENLTKQGFIDSIKNINLYKKTATYELLRVFNPIK